MMPQPGGGGPPMGGPGGGRMGSPMRPGADQQGGGEKVDPATVKNQLVMLLKKAREVAEANGVSFSEVLAEVGGDKGKPSAPPPPSAAPSGPPM